MTDLATRLEAATEGSRELSDEVLLALGFKRSRGGRGSTGYDIWHDHEGTRWKPAPDPARSVDDGLALAGDDWEAILRDALYRMLCVEPDRSKQQLSKLPLFICAALVRAKEQEQSDE